jgi:hypothetical protein
MYESAIPLYALKKVVNSLFINEMLVYEDSDKAILTADLSEM